MCCLWGKQQDLNQKAEFMLVGWQFLTLNFYRVYLITCFKAVWYEGGSTDDRCFFFFFPYKKSHNIKLWISEKIYQKHLCLLLKHSSFFYVWFLGRYSGWRSSFDLCQFKTPGSIISLLYCLHVHGCHLNPVERKLKNEWKLFSPSRKRQVAFLLTFTG